MSSIQSDVERNQTCIEALRETLDESSEAQQLLVTGAIEKLSELNSNMERCLELCEDIPKIKVQISALTALTKENLVGYQVRITIIVFLRFPSLDILFLKYYRRSSLLRPQESVGSIEN